MGNLKMKLKAFGGKHGTDMMCYGGCGMIVLGTVLTCRGVLKINAEAEEDTKRIEAIKAKYALTEASEKPKKGKGKKNGVVKSGRKSSGRAVKLSREGNKALRRAYIRTFARYAAHIAPGAALELAGMGLNIAAHRTEKAGRIQMTSLAAGYAASLAKYRKKFAEEHGEEAEKEFYYGVEKQKKEETNEKGKKVTKEEKVIRRDIDTSDFAKFFSPDYSTAATGYIEADLCFLKGVERTATRKLCEDKWLTLNELYKMLCLVDAAGQRYGIRGGNNIGWVYDKDHPENNFVDLGLYASEKTMNQDYVNGYNDVVLLEPNVNCLDLSSAMWGLDMKTPDKDLFRD